MVAGTISSRPSLTPHLRPSRYPRQPDMRLTLRTLLAYLDHTLDVQDAELLRQKVAESSFAGQLVQRIGGALANANLAAPSPLAAGPVEDPNAISEYLDSTLPGEQVAEIERACLESDAHLAEAAACHQILTMVLGTPAQVSPQLRERIYDLPALHRDSPISGQRGVADAISQHDVTPVGGDEVDTIEATLIASGIEPVGAADSGVADAPTRLRDQDSRLAATKRPEQPAGPVMAGARPRSVHESDLYGGSIRPSRITPWLVSLALMGILLFALAQLFAPVLSTRDSWTQADGQPELAPLPGEPNVPSESGEPNVPGEPEPSPTVPPSVEDDDQDMPATPRSAAAGETGITTEADPSEPTVGSEGPEPPVAEDSPASATAGTPPAPLDAPAAPAEPAAVADRTAALPDASEGTPGSAGTPAVEAAMTPPRSSPSEPAGAGAEPSPDAAKPKPPEVEELVDPAPGLEPSSAPATVPAPDAGPATDEANVVGTIDSQQALVLARPVSASDDDPTWTRLSTGAAVTDQSILIAPPTCRSDLATTARVVVTLVGPARVRWHGSEQAEPVLELMSGRILLTPTETDAGISLQIAGQPTRIDFLDVANVVAVEVSSERPPGLDPFNPLHRVTIRSILSVQGTVSVNGEAALETGQLWLQHDDRPAEIETLETLPSWTQPADPAGRSLEAGAREELLRLLAASEQSLEMTLREATHHRKAEVGALAGQTLLAMGYGDVYFGNDGILSNVEQRAYWPDHFLALQEVFNQGGAAATGLIESIERMDSANAESLVRLLTGFSQQQLAEGGDAELVQMLDSPSMAVRGLALENLHQITGKTLYFRADEENAVRRNAGIKRWTALLNRDDIRWPE